MSDLLTRLNHVVGHSPLTRLTDPFPELVPITVWLKRDDLLHPLVSGNKWRKLKYNLLDAERLGFTQLLTFGGAYSNHLYATAAAGRLFGFRTIGVVRGDELAHRPLNPTLAFCRACGMALHYVDRSTYRQLTQAAAPPLPSVVTSGVVTPNGAAPNVVAGSTTLPDEAATRHQNATTLSGAATTSVTGATGLPVGGSTPLPDNSTTFANWLAQFEPCYVLPEGGTNALALRGTAEVMPEIVGQLGYAPHYVACAVGTGGTLAGLAATAPPDTRVLGVPVLKGVTTSPLATTTLLTDYHGGGYARTTPELLAFIRAFEARTGILLEQVYTGKLLYALFDLARRGYFLPGATVVAIHTGGLQGRGQIVNTA